MRVRYLAVLLGVLLSAGRTLAVDALTGTWSPDRQIAVAEERASDGGRRFYFRDQRTGANLCDVPLHDPRPAGGEVLMRAAWNFSGTRVALLIHYDWDAENLWFFSKDANGRLQPVRLTLPNPVGSYRQRIGQLRPKTPHDYVEAGLGPWSDEETIQLFLGEARPNAQNNDYTHYYANFKVRFHGQHADVVDLRLQGPLTGQAYADHAPIWDINYSQTEWNAFGQAPIPEGRFVESNSEFRVVATHNIIAEDSSSEWAEIQIQCEAYRVDFGHFPAGDNREILRQLLGLNPKKKRYVKLPIGLFDRNGNALDLWNQPYGFEFKGKHARVIPRREKMAETEWKKGRQWPDVYDPLYHPTKTDETRSDCYQLALAIRLAVEQEGRVLPMKELKGVVFAPATPKTEPIIYADATGVRRVLLDDPWGAPYHIKLTPDHVSVGSRHLLGEVHTEPFAPAP